MAKFLQTLFLTILCLATSQAAVIKGIVRDSKSGEILVGARILLQPLNKTELSGLDGSFTFKDLPANSGYNLSATYLMYKPFSINIPPTSEKEVRVTIQLQPLNSELREVSVTVKKDGAAETTARNLEKTADGVMNIVSGKAIQLSPDLTVANVIQRVSGVSIERNNNGDGQYAILRGMDKRYNYTLVNGIKIPSPDNKYRYVPLDIFPSELLERLEVYKTLTPAMEADAIGGAVNLTMKDAPSRPVFDLNLAGGLNQLFLNRDFATFDYKGLASRSPYELKGNQYEASSADFGKSSTSYSTNKSNPNLIAGITYGNRFLKNRLGVILAGSLQNSFRGSNSLFFNSEVVDIQDGVKLTKMNERQYSEEQKRYGLHSKLDYRIKANSKLQWYNAMMSLQNIQIRDIMATQLSIGGYDPAKGNATLEYSTRSRFTKQNIYNSTLQGQHYFSNALQLQWSAVVSKASNEQPNTTLIPLNGLMTDFVPTRTTVKDAYQRWEHNSDRDVAGYLNVDYNTQVSGLNVKFSTGGLYRDKKRDNFYNNYLFRPSNLRAEYGKDFQSYSQIEWNLQNPLGSVATALNYDASEKISAGYFQFKAITALLEATGGFRVEHTQQGYQMLFPIGEDRPAGEQVYTDLLPSLNLNFKVRDNQNYRLSYYRSLNRPGFFELVPGKIVVEDYTEKGNPDLKRAIADNIDLRYELFPKKAEQLMVGAFYKYIQNPIEYTLSPDAVRQQDIFYFPGNFGNATNYGAEIDFIKYFRSFGIKANYTYTHSRITTDKSKRIRRAENNSDLETITVQQTRPLYGQAAHVANLSFLLNNVKRGFDAQVTGSYTGKRINTVSQFVDRDLWQRGFIQLDASLEKKLKRGISLFAKANNLLNTPLEVYTNSTNPNNSDVPAQDISGRTLIQRDYYQRSYLLGIRYKY
ncbi:TonB-dependent receptor domain-containing protein [Desertivirga arenae]|uniref:TonB-dependent receptor domain-containing protein n=1 Tax=Desertivirga arenae TaxID=2810309 RepID=UPI001A97935C|nr:TonB-dependent receptor [Pedobacter sp. SYSU D00823]